MANKGQVQVTFNWVYVLVAGAIILLFFAGLVIRQKAVSEQKLSIDLTQTMESIFTAAGVSEKTKNFIDISGLSDKVLEFSCSDGVSEFGLQESPSRIRNALDPLFAPRSIKAPRLILWSLPYKIPYKIIDFLFVTSSTTKIFFVDSATPDPFVDEFTKATADTNPLLQINRATVQSLNEILPEKNYHLKIVFFDSPTLTLPPNLVPMRDSAITAVNIKGDEISFYKKKGSKFVLDGTTKLVSLPAKLGETSKNDAAKYAAIFAHDKEMYECNMQKAFRRFKIINEVYGNKLGLMIKKYKDSKDICGPLLEEGVKPKFGNLVSAVNLCVGGGIMDTCSSIITPAIELRTANNEFILKSCIGLY